MDAMTRLLDALMGIEPYQPEAVGLLEQAHDPDRSGISAEQITRARLELIDNAKQTVDLIGRLKDIPPAALTEVEVPFAL